MERLHFLLFTVVPKALGQRWAIADNTTMQIVSIRF